MRNFERESRAFRVLVGPAAEPQRRATLRLELSLERGELDRLPLRDRARAEIAGERLQQRRGRADEQREHERVAMTAEFHRDASTSAA